MAHDEDDYSEFVEHPRFGRGPRVTGLNPKPFGRGVNLSPRSITDAEWKLEYGASWRTIDYGPFEKFRATRIPYTAIAADPKRQAPSWGRVTHYFDLALLCQDCDRHFIFFAEEQKHWYEELGFSSASDCIRCVECRKKQQGIARDRELYESLFHVENRSALQNLEMAEAAMTLVESGDFHSRMTERVRMLLRLIKKDSGGEMYSRVAEIQRRVLAIESRAKQVEP